MGFLKKIFKVRAPQISQDTVSQWNGSLSEISFSKNPEKNIASLKELFVDVDLMRYKAIEPATPGAPSFYIAFSDGVVDAEIINNFVVKPLQNIPCQQEFSTIEELLQSVLQLGEAEVITNFKEAVENVTYGSTLLFMKGSKEGAVLNTKKFALRSIKEPENEKILSGPRDGFTESLMQNLSQIRWRCRTHQLKIKCLTLGKITQTSVVLSYFDCLVDKSILKELEKRLQGIDIDGILDANYISELIKDNPYSPFKTTGSTERPDVVLGKLLEGRIAIFVDGTPVVLTVPFLFIENFQSSEDYYFNYYYSSFSRLLRISAFLLTLIVPGLYIATVAFHKEMLPIPLLISIAAERQNVPLPAALEAVVMLLTFDLLRETGARMPSNIGQALSIVGALVIGQAAVEAKLVSGPMIIVVATSGITSLVVPKLNAPIIYWRLFLLILSSTFGFFGLTIGLSLLLIHLNNLTSMGVDQISLSGSFNFQKGKDVLVRSPWWDMIERPQKLTQNRIRQTRESSNE